MTQPVSLFLYDVTSSYLEGTHNALAAFGYNRDGKKGKMQLVMGLLCDEAGQAVSIEVFPGNTPDSAHRGFAGCEAQGTVWRPSDHLRGRPGMIKRPANRRLAKQGLHYITAITKTPD